MSTKTISAKFAGQCSKCGGGISIGDKIEWARGIRPYHTQCPDGYADAIRIGGGSGYGYHGWSVGQVIANPYLDKPGAVGKPEWRNAEYLYVLSTSQRYYREDGMSFGVGDEQGYYYSALCRPATADESAPLIAARAEKIRRVERQKQLETAFKTVVESGEYVAGSHSPEGERLDIEAQDIYGGGRWFVIGAEYIWAVKNNGMDGDDWSRNNIRTGGAGAIGYRVPRSADIEAMIRG